MIAALGIELMERRWLPDALVRAGIRRLCARRLASLAGRGAAAEAAYADALRRGPVAAHARAANAQHYELPPEFMEKVLGPRLKYSACHWSDGVNTLAQAEESALALTVQRAGLTDGQNILELGCGWGSLTLYMAERFPKARITAVSNSAPQKRYIEGKAREKGFSRVTVLTRDVSTAEDLAAGGGPFDRAVSVEMFEHMTNYETLLSRVACALAPGGSLFVHVFAHRSFSYPFEIAGEDDWMGRHFFTGGQMPARTLLPRFQKDLRLSSEWWWEGAHYGRTAEAWLANHDRRGDEVMEIMARVYGAPQARRWNQRWRVFWMACAELFNYDGGREWGVGHYLFEKPKAVT